MIFLSELSDENGIGMIPHLLKFKRIIRFSDNIWKNSRKNLKIWMQNWSLWLELNGNHAQYVEFGQSSKFQIISLFPENIWKSSRKMWKFDILGAKSISAANIKWKWCPIHWNWLNIANSGKFPDFQKISRKKSRKILRFDIRSAKSISVTEIKWKWCPIHRNRWKKQIPENFQISRIFPKKIQKNGKFEILSSKSSSVT